MPCRHGPLMTQGMLPGSSSQLRRPSGRWKLGAQPAALFGDAHGQHFVAAGVEVVNEGPSGHAADLVLAGHAAEQHDDTEFLFRLHHDLS